MARFLESASSIKKEVKKPKKSAKSNKGKTASKPKAQSSASKKKAQKTINRLTNKYAGGSTRDTSKRTYKAPTSTKSASTSKAKTSTAPKVTRRDTTPVVSRSRNPRIQDTAAGKPASIKTSKAPQTTRRDVTPVKRQQTVDRLQQKYGENKVVNPNRKATSKANTAADKAFEKQRDRVSVSRNPRMQDTTRNTKIQTSAERRESMETAKRAIRNTPTVAKEAAKQSLIGHGKTAADVTEANRSSAIGSKIDIKSADFMRDIEKRREASTATARKTFKELSKAQDRSEQRLNKVTKNAKGLEKAWYGAVESGTGMATDMAIGMGTQGGALAAMGSRVYGNTRGKAQREGATENEDRLYSLFQAGKEVGTELMFPGAGLAGRAYGKKAALPLAERLANRATAHMTGRLADATSAGIRLLGGTAEENAEELAGWGLDPLIKEYTYGRNVRVRGAKKLLQQESDAMRANLRTPEDADRATAYLNSADFIEQNKKIYMDSGLSEKQAEKVALQMREYFAASLTGNTDRMAQVEAEIMKTVGRKKFSLKDWDKNELADTLLSTTLLTGVTGLPGAVTTSKIGHNVFADPDIQGMFGGSSKNAAKMVTQEVINSSDGTMSLRAQAMRDRLATGKDLTGTQKYDLWRGYQEKIADSAKKQKASLDLAEKDIRKNDYVQPIAMDENGRFDRRTRDQYEFYQVGDETQRKYEENFESAFNTAEELSRKLKSTEGDKSISETEEDRTRQAAAAVSALADGGITIGDVHEFAYGNDLARETLKAELGIDLDQYVVRNKDGSVDYAKTNEATENAIFAIASDNLVKTAKAETEAFIDHRKGEIDADIMSRLGAEGQAAWKEINKTLDPRQTSKYLASTNAASYMYAAGRNTTLSQNDVMAAMGNVFRTVDNNVLVKSFEAGRRDKQIADAPAVGQTVTANGQMSATSTESIPTGILTMDEDLPRSVTDTEQQLYKALAMSTGVNIHLASHLDLTDDEGNVVGQANGSSYGDTIILNLNSEAEQNLGYVFMHEMTHQIKKYAPNEYQLLENLIRDTWFEKDYAGMQRAIQHKIKLYGNRAGQTLSEAMAMEEIVADAMAEAIDDPKFARAVCTQDVGLGKAILNSITSALRNLRDMIANTVFKSNPSFHKSLLSYLDVLSEAESLWIRALNEATKARAAQAVENLQNQIYEEGRQSISESTDADYMDAVNRGDMETAQRMVDAAAEKAMPNTKLKGRWYHGTENEFTEFNFSQGGKNGHADGFGIYLTNDKEVASAYGNRMIEGYVNMERPASALTTATLKKDELHRLIKRTVDMEAETLQQDGYDSIDAARYDTWISNYTDTYYAGNIDNAIDEVIKSITDMNGNDYDIILEIMTGMGIRDYDAATSFYDILTEETGIDGYETKWGDESEMADPNTPTIALAFRSEQIKSAEPVTYDDNGDVIPLSERFNQSNPDIRYSVSAETRESPNNEGIEELADGTTARYSVTSWQETNKEKKLKALTAANHDEKTAKKWIEDIDSIAIIILGDPERLDYEADRSNKFLKPNGDYYKYTLDASTLCDKRRIYQGTYNAIQHAMPNIPLMQDDVVRIRTLLKEKDHKAPCGICYVESQRKNLGAYAKEWYDNYARKDEIRLEDVTTSDGLKELKKTNPEVAADFEKAMAAKGVSSPKVVKLRTDYREDIMRMRPSTVEYLNSIGGLRFHSFSDFETPHLIDTMQAVMDMATKNLMGMAYAKVPNFAAVFGPTGIKINLSLIAKTDENGNAVHDEDGRLVFDSVEGIPYEEAKKWRDAYPDNVAFILVGKDKEHTLEAINDDRVDFVIPFHRSKWSAEDMRRLGLVGYEDFATGHQENGIFVSEFWDYNKTGKENAERYLEVCKERGVTPIFEQLLHDNGDGTYSLQEDGSTDNYWKLLVEGKMYNHITKKGAPQQPVQPNFNMEEARRVLKEYEGGANELPVADDVVEAFVKEYKEAHPDAEIADTRLSISADLDEPYMAAVNSDNMEEAQRLVDEAAKMAMPNTKLKGRWYHGTENEFTEFNFSQGGKNGTADGFGIYLTNDPEVASSYGNRMIEGYVNVTRPASALTSQTLTKSELRRLIKRTVEDEALQMAEDYDSNIEEAKFDTWISNYTDTRYAGTIDKAIDEVIKGITSYNGNDMDIIQEIMVGMGVRNYEQATAFYDILTETTGIDGFETKWGDESEMADPNTPTIALAFKSNQIKSADPVTYAEDGSVIPLSQRFDPTNNDIRYSLPTQDADGNILSDGQMEYFKNSQARDEQGKLVPVYHASSMGGFTIFDPSYSDDRRSLFFSNKRDVAQTYVEKHLYTDEDRLGDTSLQLSNWDDLVDYAQDLYMAAGLDWEYDYEVESLGWILYTKDEKEFMADLDEWGDTYDDAYAKWAEMAKRNDPEADKYRISISLPYEDKSGDTDYKRYVADSVAELLEKVSADPVPQAGYYQVYLNLENPMIIDGKGAYWNSISLDSRIPSSTRLELITGEYLDALAESIEQQFMDEKNQREKHGYKYKDESLYTWPQYQKSKQYRKDAKEAKENGIAYLKTETGERLRAEYSPEGLAKAINKYYGFEENDSEGMLIANGMLKEIGSGMDAHSYKGAAQLRELTGESHDTREWAEIAQAEGYDGVIFRNIIDLDNKTELDEDEGVSDIFIAFGSNQVKDTRNENPTENPDIRWSVPEDEAKEKLAYEDAMDNSFEALEAYEQFIAENPDGIEDYVAKTFDGDTVAAFNSALVDYNGKKFDDKILEDGRVRMAKSREDFFNSVNAKWRESWPTEGEVLNIDSVKTNIRKLVRGVMANADVNHQYKTDVANMTLADARTAYQLMKQGRQEAALNLLYHSAQRMVEGIQFVKDDTEFQTYKEIRDFMRNSRVSIDEEYWSDVDYNAFRRENLCRMKLIRGKQNVEDVYSDLESNWPWIFNESEREKIGLGNDVPALLLHIGHVLNQNLSPFMEAYSSEEAADICFDVADQLYDIIEAGRPIKSIADSLNKRDAKKLDKLYDEMETQAEEAQREYTKTIEELKEDFDAKTKLLKVRHDEAVRKVKDNMAEMEAAKDAEIEKLRNDANASFLMRQRAIANERAAKWKAIEEEKAKRAKETERANMWRGRYKERIQKDAQDRKDKAERKDHRRLFSGIEDDYAWLTKAVLDPTQDKYIPESFRKSLADLLVLIDLQTENSKALEEKYGRVAPKTLKMRELKDRLAELSTKKAADDTNLFDIDAYLPYLMESLADKVDGKSIDEMEASDIKTVRILFKALRKNFQNLNQESKDAKIAVAMEKASRIVSESVAKVGRDGLARQYEGVRGGFNTINMTSLTPVYFFERMGTVNDIYKELRGGFDTYIRNEAQIIDKLKEILSGYYKRNNLRKNRPRPGSELEEWRDARSAETLELTNGTITMTAAQRMSLYCLSKREQAMKHMIAGGIKVTPYQAGSKIEGAKERLKGKEELSGSIILNEADIDKIKASLTPEQMKIADQLQQLMAKDMAALGNEAHRAQYGYEIFGEPDYFPIKSKDTWIPKDVNNMTDAVEKIKSFGPAKPLEVNASNAIVVDDIFSVVADHCNGMNLYNAYLVPISNFMRVYNATPTLEDGTRKPVREALEEAYGKKAMQYIDNFIRDINGIKNSSRGGLEDIMNKAIGKAKATAVAGNLRVAAQQPTAIVRAAAEINPKYLMPFLKMKPQKGAMQEMFEYCPIARWKSWGYYDTYMGRDIEDVMMNNWSMKDVALSGTYGLLDNLTWTAIWQGIKAEQHDLNPGMDVNSKAFLQICGARASEVFDKTQVVDSTFHRSDAMRNKQVAVKIFTAFMAEPTLTLNVLRAAIYNAHEAVKSGDRAKAGKILGKAVSVLLVQAAFVSVAQALADAWRGKDPGLPWGDDDDDEPDDSYRARFLHNLLYNLFDQMHLENNMYLVKDVTPYLNYMISKAADYYDWPPLIRAIMGWDQDYLYSQNNLVFAAFENMANGTAQIFKKMEKGEDYDKTWYEVFQKTLSGLGPFIGLPVGTLMRDFKPIWDILAGSVFAGSEISTFNKKGKSDDEGSSESKGDEDPMAILDEIDAENEELAKLEEKAAKKAANAPAGQKDEVLWDTLTDGYTTKLKEGHMDYIDRLREIYVRNGGNEATFNAKLLDGVKRSYKSTINGDNTIDQMIGQYDMQNFMRNQGVTDEEISDMCYHSYTGKDLKAAMRLGNEEYIIDELVPLIQAGISDEDIYKAWKQRYNYRNYTGKYTDPKYRESTGEYSWPINGTITSHFGYRDSPGGVGSTNHRGLDIAGNMGDPIHAADGGEVIFVGVYGGGGNTVRIRHENGDITEYMHMSAFNCKVGDHVGKGQQIGQVGSTGNSTGPHCHIGIINKDGKYLDPETLLS